MPKAAAASANPPALKRNQACKQCRKRKLKCDAGKPHCSTCIRQWKAQIAVPPPVGFSHPTEPTCTYDPVEGLTLAPDQVQNPAERIKLLEAKIAELQVKLQEARARSRSASPRLQHGHSSTAGAGPSSEGSPLQLTVPASSASSSNSLIPAMPIRNYSGEIMRPEEAPVLEMLGGSPLLEPDPLMQLLFSGWNTDLPDPATLHRLVDVFFKCDPCGSRVLHRSSFLAAMTLPPNHPEFPHPALLHAICASASRWTGHERSDSNRRDKFAEFHASKTRFYIDQTMSTGSNIFPVLLACIVLSWWFYAEGRWVEVWAHAGFLTRVSIPLGLNYRGTHPPKQSNSTYLAPPKSPTDLEQRRRAWWMSLVYDRLVSVGGWVHSIDERDVATEFPLRTHDFEVENALEANPQDLTTQNFLTMHPPAYTDSYILLIKACMLFGKVTDYNVRSNLRAPLHPRKGEDPRMAAGFRGLDRLVAVDFLANIPPAFKNCLGTSGADGSPIDTDLYLVHLIPHAATITLHNPHMDFSAPSCPSAQRCLHAAQQILNAYYLVTSTSFDIKRLHPFVTICWYLAAVALVQLCRRLIEIGDRAAEANVWGQINLLRLAMIEFGTQSPIGTRQEKLLQGLMSDILHMTSQAQPLAVGVPLYPFSHGSLYDPTYQSAPDPTGSSPVLATTLPQPSQYSGSDSSDIVEGGVTPLPVIWSTATSGASGPGNSIATSGHGPGDSMSMAPEEIVSFSY